MVMTNQPGTNVSKPRNEEGFALLLAMVVLLLVSAGLAMIASSLRVEMELLNRKKVELQVHALSDAVLAETMAGLSQNNSYSGLGEQVVEGGTIESQVIRRSTKRSTITTAVSYGGRDRYVEVEIWMSPVGDDGRRKPNISSWSSVP